MHDIERLDEYRWRVPKTGGMRVDAIIYASDRIIGQILAEKAVDQAANVAHLPGIVKASLAMPDAHWGYGFPIGGVAAFDLKTGVVSPGGVGYDINCGVRLMATSLEVSAVKKRAAELAGILFSSVPSGVGSKGEVRLNERELKRLLTGGSSWAVKEGFGEEDDLEYTEDFGKLPVEGFSRITERALSRGLDQQGTLGSGNHFLELQEVEEVFDEETAAAFGLWKGQFVVMLHSGSRGFGYQVCDDFLKVMGRHDLGAVLPDRQLAAARLGTDDARDYLNAMNAAANYAFANRQLMMHRVRGVFEKYFRESAKSLGLRLVYDLAHNIAKFERHTVDGAERTLLVHRKGATRAFGPGREEVPPRYRHFGQPVLIPGDMGRASYVLAGTQKAMDETFGSACHGAGRVMSRSAALKKASGREVADALAKKGIKVYTGSLKTLAEEMPEAYKDVHDVVDAVSGAGLAKKVARLKPLAVIKG